MVLEKVGATKSISTTPDGKVATMVRLRPSAMREASNVAVRPEAKVTSALT